MRDIRQAIIASAATLLGIALAILVATNSASESKPAMAVALLGFFGGPAWLATDAWRRRSVADGVYAVALAVGSFVVFVIWITRSVVGTID